MAARLHAASNTSTAINTAASAALNAQEQELALLLLPGQQLARHGTCAVAYEACTSSTQ
jgi:hypothetical protein